MLGTMPRIPYPDLATLPAAIQKTLASVPLNVVRICAHASPPLFDAQGQLGRAVATPEVLDPRLREAVVLRVAWLSDSDYELRHHIPLGRAAGLTEAELAALAGREPLADLAHAALDPLLSAAARFTDEVVVQLSPSDETLARLRQQVSDQVLVNIVLTIGCYMSIARLVAVTGIEPDAEALQRLPATAD
jgi:4-carboxymuconolactone decarboxylase